MQSKGKEFWRNARPLGVVLSLPQNMKDHRENRFKPTFFTTLSLDGGECTSSRPRRLNTGKDPKYLLNTSPNRTQSQSQRFWRTQGP
jgi:hypothetical protein